MSNIRFTVQRVCVLRWAAATNETQTSELGIAGVAEGAASSPDAVAGVRSACDAPVAVDANVYLPLLTLVVGYAGSLYTEERRDERTRARESNARAETRQERLNDRRDEFQRETLLALQGAMSQLARAAGEAHVANRVSAHANGSWAARDLLGEELNQREMIAFRDANTLRVRVADDQTRDLVDTMSRHAAFAPLAGTEGEAADAMTAMGEAFDAANGRIGELLRATY